MLNYSKTAVFLLILLAISCTPKKKEVKIEKNKSLFEKGLVVATIKGKKIEESSGLVTSAINPGMFWTHNDSGADAELFLIDQEGNIHLKVFLSGAESFDWEDIARHGADLYIADMGDNDAKREHIIIYKICNIHFSEIVIIIPAKPFCGTSSSPTVYHKRGRTKPIRTVCLA